LNAFTICVMLDNRRVRTWL